VGEIDTIAGSGDRATDPVDADGDGEADPPLAANEAHIDSPMDVLVAPDGRVLILDWNGHKVRTLESDGRVSFVIGTGIEGDACETALTEEGWCPALDAQLNHPTGMTFDPEGNIVLAAWHNSKIKRLNVAVNAVENVCGTGNRKFEGDGMTCRNEMGVDVVSFDLPSSVAYDSAGNLFLSDQANQVIRRIGTDGIITTVAGNCPGTSGFGCPAGRGYTGDGGSATLATLSNNLGQGTDPQGRITFDEAGTLYIADTANHVIRKVVPGADGVIGSGDPAEEIISTIAGTGEPGYAGDGGPAVEAMLLQPTDVAVAPDGSIFIADRGNSCIRRIDSEGVISTAAGVCEVPRFTGDGQLATEAHLRLPYGVAVDSDSNLYIADTMNHCVRKVLRTAVELSQ
jgi:sugar lactone lactonase YvrE